MVNTIIQLSKNVGVYLCLLFCIQQNTHGTTTVRINCGGDAYTTTDGITFSEDAFFTGSGADKHTDKSIHNTLEDVLYQSERLSYASSLVYNIPVNEIGNYTILLHFAETYAPVANQRLFNVDIENSQFELRNYNIKNAAGGIFTAIVEQFEEVFVADGLLTISFETVSQIPKINAIEVISNDVVVLPPPTFSLSGNIIVPQNFGTTETVTVTSEVDHAVTYSLSPSTVDFANVNINQLTGEVNITAITDALGSQIMTITGDNGSKTHSETFLLRVQASTLAAEIQQPTLGEEFELSNIVNITPEVNGQHINGEHATNYLSVSNPSGSGWRKLRLGYNNNNLWSDHQNVLSGGNNQLEIVLKDFGGNADWTKLVIRPQGRKSPNTTLSNYISMAEDLGDGWLKVSMPIADFTPHVPFSHLSFIEVPFSKNAATFDLGIRSIIFTGGTTPFEWFGENKNDNIHDGQRIGHTYLTAELTPCDPVDPYENIEKVVFMADGEVIEEDLQAPYSCSWMANKVGAVTLKAMVVDNFDLSEETSVQINVIDPNQSNDLLRLAVSFDQAPSNVDVQAAKLRYNKDFAYSLTLDDGLKDAYEVAFPVLQGGTVAANGQTYSGKFFTDGCGNEVAFRAGIALTSVNSSGTDIHEAGNAPSYLTWNEVDALYESGWDILNHSYSHAAKGWTNGQANPPLPDEVYISEIVDNQNYIRQKTANNIEATHFVVPSGDSEYYNFAHDNGMKTVFNQDWQIQGGGGANGRIRVDETVDLNSFFLSRVSISDNQSTMTNGIVDMVQNHDEGEAWWYNDFTHGVNGFTGPIGGGLQFDNFVYYMDFIEDNYGKDGNDRIWVAPLQEVHEYLTVRQSAGIVIEEISPTEYEILIDLTHVPTELRKYALSLVIDADANFSNVQLLEGTANFTFNGTVGQQLINLDWTDYPTQSSKTTTKISQNTTEPTIKIYPNPAVSHAKVQIKLAPEQSKESSEFEVKVFNLLGTLVEQTTYQVNTPLQQFDLNMADFSAGTYIVQITNQHYSFSQQLLKK